MLTACEFAQVFLCQFHVVRAVRRALAESRFALSKAVREEVEAMFVGLIYARREKYFLSLVATFRDRLQELGSRLLKYFNKNWIASYKSWSNVGRGETFSCGNSTTNRVESNWTQVKAVIGAKTGIDKCVSALLQHQVSVFRGVQSVIIKAASSTRTNVGVPQFLHQVAAVASDYVLEKLERQWEFMHVNKSDWSVRKYKPLFSQSRESQEDCEGKFIVTSGSMSYTVDCNEWSCTCFFFAVSQRIPCQHQMYISCDQLSLERLPACALAARWNMDVAIPFATAVDVNVDAIANLTFCTPGVQPMRLRRHHQRFSTCE